MEGDRRLILNNTICYLAKEHKDRFSKPITATKLYRLLAFYDFSHFRRTGYPALFIYDYQAWKNGTISASLYIEMRECRGTDKYSVSIGRNDNVREISNIGLADLDYISSMQLRLLDSWFYVLGDSSTEYYRGSPRYLTAWRVAWHRRSKGSSYEPMSYTDECPAPKTLHAYLETR